MGRCLACERRIDNNSSAAVVNLLFVRGAALTLRRFGRRGVKRAGNAMVGLYGGPQSGPPFCDGSARSLINPSISPFLLSFCTLAV
jgi:hypothetical protein